MSSINKRTLQKPTESIAVWPVHDLAEIVAPGHVLPLPVAVAILVNVFPPELAAAAKLCDCIREQVQLFSFPLPFAVVGAEPGNQLVLFAGKGVSHVGVVRVVHAGQRVVVPRRVCVQLVRQLWVELQQHWQPMVVAHPCLAAAVRALARWRVEFVKRAVIVLDDPSIVNYAAVQSGPKESWVRLHLLPMQVGFVVDVHL